MRLGEYGERKFMSNKPLGESDYHKKAALLGYKWTGEVLPKNNQGSTTWKCLECDHTRRTKYSSLRVCKHGIRRKRLTEQDFRELASRKGAVWLGDKLPGGRSGNTTWVCLKCKHVWVSSYSTLYNSAKGCPACAGNAPLDERDYAIFEEFGIRWVGGILPKSAKTKTLWLCLNCEHEWQASYGSLKRKPRCSVCSSEPGVRSKGERETEKILKELYIEAAVQARFDGCRDKYSLPFDFYLPAYHLLIEYQGRQHYDYIPWFGSYEEYETLRKHDQMKRDFAARGDNPYTLLEIKYTEFEHIYHILTTFLRGRTPEPYFAQKSLLEDREFDYTGGAQTEFIQTKGLPQEDPPPKQNGIAPRLKPEPTHKQGSLFYD